MAADTSIARLRDGGKLWALGALMGDDEALAALARPLFERWRGGDRLVVLGNMLGPNGDPVRTLDWLLALRRRLLAAPGARACDLVFLRGAQEEMWHRALRLQFALTPLQIFDWMLERGLAAIVEAYGLSIAEGRGACRNGPSTISRWTGTLRSRQAAYAGHADLLNALSRAARNADGTILLSAAGADPARALDSQADAFWWNSETDETLAAAIARSESIDWSPVRRMVRGVGPSENRAGDEERVVTVARPTPALIGLAADGSVIERIEA